MEFKDVIYGRRSVRKYKPDPVDETVLTEIIDAGLWAPSGVNLQPWYFVAVQSPEKIAELKELMAEVARRDEAHLKERFEKHPDVVAATMQFIRGMGNAPCVVLAFQDKPDYSWALREEGVIQSIAAAMENIVLSAYDHGVSSCWMTAVGQADMGSELRDRFAPGHGELVCLATLGYAENPNQTAPKRKEGKFVII